jgi:hypothetical protein
MLSSTCSIGGGANGARVPAAIGRALSTVSRSGMRPISKICDQR